MFPCTKKYTDWERVSRTTHQFSAKLIFWAWSNWLIKGWEESHKKPAVELQKLQAFIHSRKTSVRKKILSHIYLPCYSRRGLGKLYHSKSMQKNCLIPSAMERTSHERLTIKISSILVHHEQNYEGFKRNFTAKTEQKGNWTGPNILADVIVAVGLLHRVGVLHGQVPDCLVRHLWYTLILLLIKLIIDILF